MRTALPCVEFLAGLNDGVWAGVFGSGECEHDGGEDGGD